MLKYMKVSLMMVVSAACLWAGAAYGGEYYSNPQQGDGKGCFLYMSSFTIDGYQVEEGDEVGAFCNGVLKGSFTAWADGVFHSSMVFGEEGDEIQFRIVDKSRKREFAVTNTFILQNVSMGGHPSVQFASGIGVEVDTDGDGLCDYWERYYGLNENVGDGSEGASGDIDGDGVINIIEYGAGSSPVSGDTDGDSYADLMEIVSGSNPDDPGSRPPVVRVNFGPSDSSLPGYIPDSGERGITLKGYGWQ